MASTAARHSEMPRRLHRASVKHDIEFGRMLAHLGLPDVTDDEIDAALLLQGRARPADNAALDEQ